MYQHHLIQRRVITPDFLPLSLARPLSREQKPAGRFLIKCIFLVFVILLVVAALIWQFGWVKVVGQIGKHFVSPVYRFLSLSDLSKKHMVRALPIESERLQVFVISLKRATERRDYMINQLEGIDYNLIDAIDGTTYDFQKDEDVYKYMGSNRMKEAGLDGKEDCVLTNSCPQRFRIERQRMALDLTYIKLFRRIADDPHLDAAIVLEDDAAINVPAAQFKEDVFDRLRHIPKDWHLLMLFAFEHVSTFGPEVAPGIKILRSGVGTAAFVIKKETAQYVLDIGTRLFPELVIDLLMCGFLVETSLINGYVAQPLIAGHGKFISTKDASMLRAGPK